MGLEQAIADVFASLEAWLVSAGATASMLRLSWAVLTFLWLAHVAVVMRPGAGVDFVALFGRLALAAGLLLAVGPLNQVILLVFQTMRDAGFGILTGLIGQTWNQVIQAIGPAAANVFGVGAGWLTYPWALAVLIAGLVFGLLLFAVGLAVYLAILFFAHLTLLLGLFLSPLAIALLAAPGTARWTVRWAAVIARTALVVFTVRVIHAAALYLAILFPLRQAASGLANGFPGAGGGATLGSIFPVLLNLTWLLLLETVGTVIGAYAMFRAERLTGQFVDGVSFAEGIFAAPLWLAGRVAAAGERASEGRGAEAAGRLQEEQGGAQDATVYRRYWGA